MVIIKKTQMTTSERLALYKPEDSHFLLSAEHLLTYKARKGVFYVITYYVILYWYTFDKSYV